MEEVDLSVLTRVDGGSPHLSGHLARPAGDGPWPAVVVVHEAFGVDEVMLRHVERLARAGYLALMPDLYSEGGLRRCLVSTLRAFSSGRGRAFDDIEASRRWLAGRADCTGRVGVIGFCMGGGFALLSANRGFDAGAVNYGYLPKDLDAALEGACPLVTSYGAKDRSLRGASAKLDAALGRAGVAHDSREYPGAGHAFLNDAMVGPRVLHPLMRVTGIGPHPESSADAWKRIDAFFAEHLQQAERLHRDRRAPARPAPPARHPPIVPPTSHPVRETDLRFLDSPNSLLLESGPMNGRLNLTRRLHVDLARVSSAFCRRAA